MFIILYIEYHTFIILYVSFAAYLLLIAGLYPETTLILSPTPYPGNCHFTL